MADERDTPEADDTRELVALQLAQGRSVRAAAEACQVSERTVFRWLAEDPALKARIAALRSAMLDEAVGRFSMFAGQAAVVMAALLKSPSESVRLAAARSIADYAIRLKETAELEEQVRELWRRIERL